MNGEHFKYRFVVNEHLDVAWDKEEKRVQVLVDGKPVLHCAFLVANVSPTDVEIESIDDLGERKDTKVLEGRNARKFLSVEEEVAAHASNIQAWAENDYNTRLLHSNIAFPVLKVLVKAGDLKAKRVLESELLDRFQNGSESTRITILTTYSEFLELSVLNSLLPQIPRDHRRSAWINRARSLDGSREVQETIYVYKMASEGAEIDEIDANLDPSDVDFWINLGIAQDKSGDLPSAIRSFHKAVTKVSTNARARDSLSKVLNNYGIKDGVFDANREEYANIWNDLANSMFYSGDMEGAIDSYRKVVRLFPEHQGGWFNLGNALRDSGNALQAIDAYKKAITIKPDDANTWVNLGIAFDKAGDIQHAIDAFRKTISLKQDDIKSVMNSKNDRDHFGPDPIFEHMKMKGNALYHLGRMLNQIGDSDGAIDAYRQAVDLNRDLSDAWFQLGLELKKKGIFQDTIEAFSHSDDINAPIELCTVQLNQGLETKDQTLIDTALYNFRNSIENAPDIAIYHTALGEALEKTGRLEEAIFEYQMAFELDPNEKNAVAHLKRLEIPLTSEAAQIQVKKDKIQYRDHVVADVAGFPERFKVKKFWLSLDPTMIRYLNEIEDIEEDIIGLDEITPALKSLELDNNAIAKIKKLDRFTMLTNLSLHNNKITRVEGLEHLTSLGGLDLSYNQIERIEGLSSLTELNTLKLENNQIKRIDGLEALKKLHYLDLGENQISEISGLESLSELDILHLYNNQIVRIQGLNELKNVSSISLSHNKITKIEGFEGLTNLKRVDLRDNLITSVAGLETFPEGCHIDLANNPIPPALIEKLGGWNMYGKFNDMAAVRKYCQELAAKKEIAGGIKKEEANEGDGKDTAAFVKKGDLIEARDDKGTATESHLKDNVSEPIISLRKATEAKPNDIKCWVELGHALIEASDYHGGADAFRRATEIKHDSIESWNGFGDSERKLGNYKEAIDAFQEVLRISGSPILDTKGRKTSSELAELDPAHKEAWINLVDTYIAWNKPFRAMSTAKKAVEQYPSTPSFHVELGKALELVGDKEGAISTYRDAIKIDKKHPEPIRSLIEQAKDNLSRISRN